MWAEQENGVVKDCNIVRLYTSCQVISIPGQETCFHGDPTVLDTQRYIG